MSENAPYTRRFVRLLIRALSRAYDTALFMRTERLPPPARERRRSWRIQANDQALVFIVGLALGSVGLSPAMAGPPPKCAGHLQAAELEQGLTDVRGIMLSKMLNQARDKLQHLQDRLDCAGEPLPGRSLARLYYLEAMANFSQAGEAATQSEFERAIVLYSDLEWDTELATELGYGRDEANVFRNARAVASKEWNGGNYQAVKGDVNGVVYVDGEEVLADKARIHSTAQGLHFVQFRVKNGDWENRWIEFGASPIALKPQRSPTGWERFAGLGGESLWLLGGGLELAGLGAGPRFDFSVRREMFEGGVWLGLYPLSAPTGNGQTLKSDIMEAYSEASSLAMRGGVSGSLVWAPAETWRLSAGLGIGGLDVPEVPIYCQAEQCPSPSNNSASARSASRVASQSEAGQQSSQELWLLSSRGGFGSAEFRLHWRPGRLVLLASIEAGMAVLATQASGEYSSLDSWLSSPFVAGRVTLLCQF